MEKGFGTAALGHGFLEPEPHLFCHSLYVGRGVFLLDRGIFFLNCPFKLHQWIRDLFNTDRQDVPAGRRLYTKKSRQEHRK